MMMSLNLSDIANLDIKDADYYCIVCGISKSEAIKLMQKFDFFSKKRNIIKHKFYYHS